MSQFVLGSESRLYISADSIKAARMAAIRTAGILPALKRRHRFQIKRAGTARSADGFISGSAADVPRRIFDLPCNKSFSAAFS